MKKIKLDTSRFGLKKEKISDLTSDELSTLQGGQIPAPALTQAIGCNQSIDGPCTQYCSGGYTSSCFTVSGPMCIHIVVG